MERFDDSIALWRCSDFDTALVRATEAAGERGDDIGIWSFERRWGKTFYVAPVGDRIRFASHLCRVVEAETESGFADLDDLAA